MERNIAAGIVEALKKPPKGPNLFSILRWQEKAFRDGWLPLCDIEDLLADFDDRLWGIGVRQIAERHGIRLVPLYERPKNHTTSQVALNVLPVADLIALLVVFERLGFGVDPSEWVERLLPAVKGKKLITYSEMTAIQYAKARHKDYPLDVLPQPEPGPPLYGRDEFRTTTGHKVCAYVTPSGEVAGVTVTPPKYRRKPPPTRIVCPDCGRTWDKGDPQSSRSHRNFHQAEMRIRAPLPHADLLAALDAEASPEEVLPDSPQWKHELVYAYAVRFCREFEYDFVQWNPKKRNDGAVGFVFADDTGRFGRGAPVGGCAFRLRESEWTLDWIWVIPAMRRQGVLSRRWEHFRQRFGEFRLQTPLSDAMKEFAARHAPWLDTE